MAQLTIYQMASVAYFVSGLWSSVVALVFFGRASRDNHRARDNKIAAVAFMVIALVASLLSVLAWFGVGGPDRVC